MEFQWTPVEKWWNSTGIPLEKHWNPWGTGKTSKNSVCCQIWQVLSVNYWFWPWKHIQRSLGCFRAPRQCSSVHFTLLLLPFLCLPVQDLHFTSDMYIRLIETYYTYTSVLNSYTNVWMHDTVVGCCWGCAQLRHKLALFLGLAENWL